MAEVQDVQKATIIQLNTLQDCIRSLRMSDATTAALRTTIEAEQYEAMLIIRILNPSFRVYLRLAPLPCPSMPLAHTHHCP